MRGPTPLLVVLALAGAGCVAPARTSDAYEAKAVDSADATASAARTVLLVARTAESGRAFAAGTAVAVSDAETDAESALDAFASIEPPDERSDALRRTLLSVVRRAVAVIQLARIAARRADAAALERVAAPLGPLADRLDAFATRYG